MTKRLSVHPSKLKINSYYYVTREVYIEPRLSYYRQTKLVKTLIKITKMDKKKIRDGWMPKGYRYNIHVYFSELTKKGALQKINTKEIINNIRYYPLTFNKALEVLPSFTIKTKKQKVFVREALQFISENIS